MTIVLIVALWVAVAIRLLNTILVPFAVNRPRDPMTPKLAAVNMTSNLIVLVFLLLIINQLTLLL